MAWENPIKTVRLCFFGTGHLKEHFTSAEDDGVVDRLVSFLRDSDAVIVDLENFTPDEVERLKGAEGRGGRSLFASTNCFAREDPNGRARCARLCPLKVDA
jgi:hypothetical protein